jgi:hypothetical protein
LQEQRPTQLCRTMGLSIHRDYLESLAATKKYAARYATMDGLGGSALAIMDLLH